MNEPSPAPPLQRRLVDLLVAPGRLFRSLRSSEPPWVDVLLLGMLIAALAALLTPPDVFLAQMDEPVTRRGEPVVVTSTPEQIVRYGRFLAMLSAAVWHPFLAFAFAGLLALVFTVLGGGNIPFRQHLSASSHAILITVAGTLIVMTVGTVFRADFEPTLRMLTPGLAEGSVAYALLSSINVFTVWMLLLLGRAVAVFDPRRSTAAASAVLLAIYLALVMLVAGLTT